MDRVVALDRLGFDEAWFGEHHSGGYELIACPEVFIAAAAERTKHLRLGTGVVSLPYHHPLMVADRWVLLDHLTRGRVMFGAGPGALPSDAYMMGIDPIEQRRMMHESLEAILARFRAAPGERISRHSDWFTLRDAQLHIRPYTWPYPEISTAAMISPSGPRLAGTWARRCCRCRCRCRAATRRCKTPGTSCAKKAGKADTTSPMGELAGARHPAPGRYRDQAIDDCTDGGGDFANTSRSRFVPLPTSWKARTTPRVRRRLRGEETAGIGTAEEAIGDIEDLLDRLVQLRPRCSATTGNRRRRR